jgi:hypothetical protein
MNDFSDMLSMKYDLLHSEVGIWGMGIGILAFISARYILRISTLCIIKYAFTSVQFDQC